MNKILKLCTVCGHILVQKGRKTKQICDDCTSAITKGHRWLPPSRRCKVCGKPTNDYRCDQCKVGNEDGAVTEYTVLGISYEF